MLVIIILLCALSVQGQFKKYSHECNTVTIPMCTKMPYNATRMPNLLGHHTQEEAAIMAHEFLPLVDIKCSPYVRFFICSVFAPMCTEKVPYGIPSCRSVCTTVRSACLPLLRNLNFTWPKFLQCGSFPKESDGLCMVPPDLRRTQSSKSAIGGTKHKYIPFTTKLPPYNYRNWSHQNPTINTKHLPDVSQRDGLCMGPRIWIQTSEDGGGICVPLCNQDFLFAAKDKKIAMAWASSWALVSLLSTSFSLLTFCLDRKRFDYPERPVICLALSYFCYSIAFFVRLIFPGSSLSCESDPSTGQSHLATSGISSPGCITTFLLQYYFGIASEIWWTILTYCWFMTACRFWGSEGLKTYATYFHTIAWGLPALGSVAAITMKQVSGDELLGMCFVGTFAPWAQLYLVIIPQAILLTLGTIFIILGFGSLFRIRNAFRREFSCSQNAASSPASSFTTLPPSTSPSCATQSTPTIKMAASVGKLERLMVRLGVFSVLSTLPALFVLGCRLHAHFKYHEWVNNAAQASVSCETGWNQHNCGPRQSYPEVEIDLLRIFMSLIIGVTSGIWVWSHKTIILWKQSLRRCFGLQYSGSNFLKPIEHQTRSPVEPVPPERIPPKGYITLQDSLNPLLRCEGHVSRTLGQERAQQIQVIPHWEPYNPEYNLAGTSSELITSFV